MEVARGPIVHPLDEFPQLGFDDLSSPTFCRARVSNRPGPLIMACRISAERASALRDPITIMAREGSTSLDTSVNSWTAPRRASISTASNPPFQRGARDGGDIPGHGEREALKGALDLAVEFLVAAEQEHAEG